MIDHKVLSCLVTHVAGLVVLSLSYCAHSLLVRGVYLDDDDLDASAAILPYQYVRYFIQKVYKQITNSIQVNNLINLINLKDAEEEGGSSS